MQEDKGFVIRSLKFHNSFFFSFNSLRCQLFYLSSFIDIVRYKHLNSSGINCLSSTKTANQKQNAQFSVNTPNRSVPGDIISGNMIKGIDHLRDPRLNKGLAFTLAERQVFGIHGLLSSEFRTLEQQMAICKLSVDRYRSLLNKYLYLMDLQDTNETLFYTLLNDNIEKYMPLLNTPTIGLACMRFGLVYKRARGLFITKHDRGYIMDVMKNWPERDVRAVVVTDGERVMGLGDLGAHGMGIPQSKIVLLTALAGIKPHQCLPVCLDCGTNNMTLIEDPLYIGLREKRHRVPEYDNLVEEFLESCRALYGPQTVVMMEDFGLPNAHRLLKKFRTEYCLFNDDIQATAAVVVAGLMVGCKRILKEKLGDNTYMFLGAGSSGVGIANLLCQAMVEEGLTPNEARKKCFMFDIDGLLSRKRLKPIGVHAYQYARDLEPDNNFENCVKKFKATCIIGTSATPNAFTPQILRAVADNAVRPFVFALSNPTHHSECTAQEAYDHTDGRCIFASGSPFPQVLYQGKMFSTSQANNYYIFPGIVLGALACNATMITDDMFLAAAKTLSETVAQEDLAVGRIYPNLKNMLNVSLSIAAELVAVAFEDNLTNLHRKPEDIIEFVRDQVYDFKYGANDPKLYEYPEPSEIVKLKNIEILHKGLIPRTRRPRATQEPPMVFT